MSYRHLASAAIALLLAATGCTNGSVEETTTPAAEQAPTILPSASNDDQTNYSPREEEAKKAALRVLAEDLKVDDPECVASHFDNVSLADLEASGISTTGTEDDIFTDSTPTVLYPLLLATSHCTPYYDDLVLSDESNRGLEPWVISCITDLGRANPEFVGLYALGVPSGQQENLSPDHKARFERAVEARQELVDAATELGRCPSATTR